MWCCSTEASGEEGTGEKEAHVEVVRHIEDIFKGMTDVGQLARR